ncbi:MAG: phosphotransferase [Bdellovibrionaceae bacterium]|nr:phosphotransferase [Pseudobdellovibrionaceae bacterium]
MDPKIGAFLEGHFKDNNSRVLALAGDASSRKYYRVIRDQDSWVLMFWEPFDKDKYPFLSVLNHFAKNGVHVPQVVHYSEADGLVLLEDLGDLTLERKFWENQNQEMALRYYRMAIDELVKIHFHSTRDRSPCTAFDIEFDTEKLLWEMKYGFDNLILGVCQFEMSPAAKDQMIELFRGLCDIISSEPKFIAHRDYHSRNLMIKLDTMRVIDFQDARMGAMQYDLVSLLRDSYVNMSDSMAQALLEDYLIKGKEFLPKSFSREHFDYIYELQTIQRCFKACGSFASFYNQRKDTRYLKYLSHTLRRVLKSVTEFPQYKAFADVLIDSGSLERKYEVL